MKIQSKRVWIADQFVPAILEFEDTIKHVYPYGTKDVDIDYGNKRIVPGFIDIHCHGAYGFDTNDANEEGLKYWAKHIGSEGVTAFCPTTITHSEETLMKAVYNVGNVIEEGYEGSEILGVHLEGPYLSVEFKGAQPESYITKPNIEQFKRYMEVSKGHIVYMTLAVENDENYEFTNYLVNHGVTVSIGHSAATYDECVMAHAYGASCMTHVFNGMSRFHHRDNGLTNAALRIRNMYGEIICDGNHSTPAVLNTYFLSKGANYPIMVSDAVMAKNTPVGSKFLFGGQEIEVYEDGSAHIIETGGLAGSTLKLNEGLRILVEEAQIPFNYALNSCTINPATCLNIQDRKGSLQVGKDSDIVILNDDYSVEKTYCKGK